MGSITIQLHTTCMGSITIQLHTTYPPPTKEEYVLIFLIYIQIKSNFTTLMSHFISVSESLVSGTC